MSRRRAIEGERSAVADIPDQIVLKRHRDLVGRERHIWYRRAIVSLVALMSLLGLANVFGQRPHGKSFDSAAAKLELYAPEHLRGGLLYEARFTITAHQDVKNAILQFSPGWLEGQTMNTVEPSPLGEASRNGDLLFTLGHIPAGTKYRMFMQFQVNPTNIGSRTADVTLYDGGTKLGRLERDLTFFP
jgi:hypothetical protein